MMSQFISSLQLSDLLTGKVKVRDRRGDLSPLVINLLLFPQEGAVV